jgi:hypothetical protein
MKLFAGIAISFTILIGSETDTRPDPFFTPGNRIIYESQTVMKRGKGYTVRQIFEVEKVRVHGSSASSECLMGYYATTELNGFRPYYRLYYDVDTVNFYSHAKNWCYIPEDYKDYGSFDVKGDSLIYPLNMKAGDTLPGARASISYSIHQAKVSYSIKFINRKVLQVDTVSTAFGKVVAYKISMNSLYDVKSYEAGNGQGSRNFENQLITEWFAPQYGIIKMQYDLPDGAFMAEMISYKRD